MKKNNALKKQLDLLAQRSKKIHLKLLSEQWQVSIEELVDAWCKLDHFYESYFTNDLIILERYNEQMHFEIAYRKNNYFVRNEVIKTPEISIDKQNTIPRHDHLHHSVFTHDENWLNAKDAQSRIGFKYLYIELDRDSFEQSLHDAYYIIQGIPEPARKGVVTWHSGNKSVHIGLSAWLFGNPILEMKHTGRGNLCYNMAAHIAGDNRHGTKFDPWMHNSNKCKQKYRNIFKKPPDKDDPQWIRQQLEVFDPNLYNMNSLIRMPYSLHEKTMCEKTEIDILSPENYMHISYKNRHLTEPMVPPYFLHLLYTKNKNRVKHKPKRKTKLPSNFVIDYYKKYIDLEEGITNSQGWTNELYSPFYEDTNPSVSICTDQTAWQFGWYHDFGNPDHIMDFYEFVAKTQNISKKNAVKYASEKIKNRK